MRTKRAFVPSSLGGMDHLEDRMVLSHGAIFSHGSAVLTAHAYSKTMREIRAAFVHFTSHGQNFANLNADLAKAVNRIPFHKVGGLDNSMTQVVSQLKDDIANKVDTPVKIAYNNALSILKDSVRSGVDSGSIVRR